MATDSAEKKPEPKAKLADHVDIGVDVIARMVTFTTRPRFAIHPVVVAVPIAVLKATLGEILKVEAQAEMGGEIKTERTVTQSPAGTKS